ncbi:MAG TPA: hypothetical protein VFV70_14320 [Hyphomonadaceae bacterium]|nr:hypothetical protein [Hyphomonadaceae bacterium]
MYQSRWERDKSGAAAARGKAMQTTAGGKVLAQLMTCAAMAVLAGCKIVSDPPKAIIAQDVEFLRGCWVAKTAPGGTVTGFLRLLPEGRDGTSYQGYVQVIANGQTAAPMHLSFARDGSSMTMRSASGRPVLPMDDGGGLSRPYAPLPEAIVAKLPKVAHRATFAVYPGRADSPWMAAEGDGEHLAIYAMGNGGQQMGDLFRGERDGCD